jgi:hypothetical protein
MDMQVLGEMFRRLQQNFAADRRAQSAAPG